ncbi:TPA_asm: N [Ilex alphacytorhabdovirus 1]|nr:TPA_asm: N [Ilex alphacytorhabdovirus 1]
MEFTKDDIEAMRALIRVETPSASKTKTTIEAADKGKQSLEIKQKEVKTAPTKQAKVIKKNPYSDLADITVSLSNAPKVWNDSDINNIQIVDVSQLPADSIISLGSDMLDELNGTKISSDTIDIILSLAVSMFKPGSSSNAMDYVLKPIPPTMGHKLRGIEIEPESIADKERTELQEKIERAQRVQRTAKKEEDRKQAEQLEADLKRQMEELSGEDEDEKLENSDIIMAYTYLAAYLMRLPGKTSEVWLEKMETAKTRFNAWYDCESTILEDFSMTVDTAEKLRDGFARRPDALATWLLWLSYNENENKEITPVSLGMLRYMALQMYTYTGMHAYASIMALSVENNITFDVLLQELLCPATKKAINEVANIIRHYELTERNPKRKTYFRYARNWDSGYFLNLQSKNCTILGYTVAKTRKMLSASSAISDPTQAFAFRNMDDKLKSSLDSVADKLYSLILARSTKDEESGSIWM